MNDTPHPHSAKGATTLGDGHGPGEASAGLKDPVCGMSVTAESTHRLEHDGRPYYFCSTDCQTRFATNPSAYIDQPPVPEAPPAATAATEAAADAAGVIYTCPMHPQVRQEHPGNCPICGMTLEPLLPDLDEDENPELTSFTQRFWWTLPLTVVVTLLAMFGHRLGWFDMATQSWIELVLALPIVLWAGHSLFGACSRSSIAARTCGPSSAWVPGLPSSIAWWRRWRPACFRRRSSQWGAWRSISRRRRSSFP